MFSLPQRMKSLHVSFMDWASGLFALNLNFLFFFYTTPIPGFSLHEVSPSIFHAVEPLLVFALEPSLHILSVLCSLTLWGSAVMFFLSAEMCLKGEL